MEANEEKYEKHQRIYDELKESGNILFETVIGSQAHGTATPESDVDTSFVYMAPEKWLYARRDYHEHLKLSKDRVGYELEFFLNLAATNNPTCMELLWAPEDCWIIKNSVYDMVMSQREAFMSKVAQHSYLGYAASQIRKAQGMDKFQNWSKERTTKKDPIDFCWVLKEDGYSTEPLKALLERYGMEEYEIGVASVDHAPNTYALFHMDPNDTFKGIFGINSDQIVFSSIPKGRKPLALMVYNRDAFKMHHVDWKRYTEWKENANKDRWVETSDGNSIDGKNIMHFVRLMQMNKDIAMGVGCNVRRPNKEELLSIRRGERTLDEIIKWSHEEEKEIKKLYAKSALPEKVDMEFVRDLLLNMREVFYRRMYNIKTYDNRFIHATH